MSIRLCLLVLGIPLAAIVGPGIPIVAGADTPREYDVKAAFLYHFTTFVDWPAEAFSSPETPFVIGVFGDDPFGRVLDELVANEYMDQHPLQVRRVRLIEEVDGCHLIFIAHSESRRFRALLERVRNRPVLTVGDIPEFAEHGGIIGFSTISSRVQLHINIEAARAAGLTVSSKLLELSQVVAANGQ